MCQSGPWDSPHFLPHSPTLPPSSGLYSNVPFLRSLPWPLSLKELPSDFLSLGLADLSSDPFLLSPHAPVLILQVAQSKHQRFNVVLGREKEGV